jgi:plasmid stability protein
MQSRVDIPPLQEMISLTIVISLIAQWDSAMASITIRNLDDRLKGRLRVRAAQHGRSMEDEVRHILRAALAEARQPANLADAIRRRFAPFGGLELRIPPRGKLREPPRFDK